MKKVVFIIVIIVIIIGAVSFVVFDTDNRNQNNNSSPNDNVVNSNSIVDTVERKEVYDSNKQVVYKELTPELNEGKVMFVNKVIDKDSSYELQGILFGNYVMSQLELDSLLESGTIVLDGKIYAIKDHSDEYNYFDKMMYDLFEEGSNSPLYFIVKDEDEYVLKRGAQIDYCYKSTGEFVTITIDKNTSFEENIGIADEPIATVEKEFNNYIPGELRDNDTFPIPTYTFEFTDGKCTFVRAFNGI